MSARNRQFDPVAAAATAALDASQRNIRQVRSQVDAPELPAESQAFSGARNAIQSASSLSPANVLAKSDGPVPSPNEVTNNLSLPGMDGGSMPSGMEALAPSNVLSNLPDPAGILPDGNSRRNRRDRSGSNGGSSGGSNGGSSGSSGGSGSSAMSRRRNR